MTWDERREVELVTLRTVPASPTNTQLGAPTPGRTTPPAGGAAAMTRRRRRNGFTLIEVLIALSIVAALLTIAFAGLRVAMNAWTKGEDRAEVHQHLRGIAMVLGVPSGRPIHIVV